MATETEDGGGKGTGSAENGPLKGGRPIDPVRHDKEPHPTEEAERRARDVQSGGHGGDLSHGRDGGKD